MATIDDIKDPDSSFHRLMPREWLTLLGLTDLAEEARQGRLRQAYQYDGYVTRILATLSQPRSVLLLGQPGVGKTALVHECTIRIAGKQQCAATLHDTPIYTLSTSTILAGARHCGDWETRLGAVLMAMKAMSTAVGRLPGILSITNIGDLPLAGTSEHQSESFLTFLRPYLERHDITLIGESTVEGFRSMRIAGGQAVSLTDAPGMRDFSVIPLVAPDQATTRAILDQIVDERMLAIPYQVESEALARCVQLPDRFQRGEAFPGKAIRLLEEALRAQDTTDSDDMDIVPGPTPRAMSTHSWRFSGKRSPDVVAGVVPATMGPLLSQRHSHASPAFPPGSSRTITPSRALRFAPSSPIASSVRSRLSRQ